MHEELKRPVKTCLVSTMIDKKVLEYKNQFDKFEEDTIAYEKMKKTSTGDEKMACEEQLKELTRIKYKLISDDFATACEAEFLRYYSANMKRTKYSIVSDLFTGFFHSTTKCSVCNNRSIIFEPFTVISLDIPSDGIKPHYKNV